MIIFPGRGKSACFLAKCGTGLPGGIVLGQGKAVFPGVTITATIEATGQERRAVAGGERTFVIPTRLPGTYSIKAVLQGLEPTTRTGRVLPFGSGRKSR